MREREAPNVKHRILVVDDNKDSATTLAMMLRLLGNEVRTANDGFEAIEVAESFRPDVALLDIGLPRMDGYETAQRIRRQAGGEEMYLIAATGWSRDDDRQRATEAGFDTHMVKPVDLAALESLLASLPRAAR